LVYDNIETLAADIGMTRQERVVLARLARDTGRVVRREDLLHECPGIAPRTLDTHIKNIRRKLRSAGYSREIVVTEFGVGFLFTGLDSK